MVMLPKEHLILRNGLIQILESIDLPVLQNIFDRPTFTRRGAFRKQARCLVAHKVEVPSTSMRRSSRADLIELRVYSKIGIKIAQEITSKGTIFAVTTSGVITKSAKCWLESHGIRYSEKFPINY